MSKPWAPDGASSRALLIGVSDYTSPGLEQIPAVRNNLDALKDALSGERGLLPPDHIRVLGAKGTPVDEALIGEELASVRREAEDLLLIYYAGHGLLDDDGLLHLAVTDTDPDPGHAGYTALPFQLLKQELAQSRAKARVLVLDCCFSGRAVAAMSPQHTLLSGQLDLNGTYTLTSTTATAPSHAPPGAHHTAFTEALLSALTQPEAHTLDDIYQHIDQKLNSNGLPRPQARSVNAASNLVLTRGPAKTKPPTTHTPTPTPPPGPPEVQFRAKVSWRKRLPNPLLMFCLPLMLLVIFSASIGAGFFTSKGALLLLMSLPVLHAMRVLTRNVRAKYASLSIDGTGLSVDKPGWPPFRIAWENVSHLGVLDNYVFSTKNHGVLKAEKVLIVRLRQGSPRIKGTLLAPAKGNEVPHSLRRIKYVGFPIQDFDADPTQLRQAVERLSGRPYRSDLELGEVDPRLRSVVPHM